MSKAIRLVCRLLPVLAALAIFTGCRKPTIPLDGIRSMEPPSTQIGVGGTPVGTDFPVFPPPTPKIEDTEPGGWKGMEELPDEGLGSGVLQPKRWEGVAVYFGYDSAAIGPSEMPKIKALAKHLKDHPDYGVIVEGNCDERGSDEYNRALGQQRAIVVRDHLCAEGIDESRIETISYGEDRPAVPNATDEAGHQKNRRAEFLIGPLNK